MNKSVAIGFISVTAILFALIIPTAISRIVFDYTIDGSYSQYELVAQGKLAMETDCVGNRIFAIGGYNIPLNKRTCSSYKKEDARSYLGGDCEYKVYKGWYWGLGDFYYITAK